MSLRSFLKVSEKYIINNAPTLLSGIAVTGTLATAYLTGKATIQAVAKIDEELEMRYQTDDIADTPLTKTEVVKLVWPLYVPPALAVVGTVGCIVTANSLSAKRIAAMAALYKLSEDHLEEYRDKVKEKLGLKEEQELREEIHHEKVRDSFDALRAVQLEEPGMNVMFMEAWTGRYFYSTMGKVERAMNDINRDIVQENYATLSDFYDRIDVEPTQESNEIGWSIENPIDLHFTVSTTKDGAIPVHVMEYSNRPHFIRDYGRMR